MDLRQVPELARVQATLTGLPACIAGSLVSACTYDKTIEDKMDVDVFCFTEQTLISTTGSLVDQGYHFDDRFERVWSRWLSHGLRGWHTNSMKLLDPYTNRDINLVYKLVNGVPANSLAGVLESFDFGLLAQGYDLSTGTFRDMRGYLFPGMDLDGPLPFMPNKRSDWSNGFISQYNGLRESGRYAKYVNYGYDMSLIKDDMLTGYALIARFMRDRGDPEKVQLAEIYERIAELIVDDDIDQLMKAGLLIPNLDQLDQILEALE